MAPLPAPEPARHLETTASLQAGKLRFEVNRLALPIGVEGTFGVIRHPGAALAVPLLDDGRVVVLRQYRFAVATRVLEFPAGTLDPGETPLSTMRRELQEEAGYAAERWDPLGTLLPCPGYADEVIHLFLARELTALSEQPVGDDDEDLEVLLLQPAELDAALASGDEYLDGKSVTAWLRAKQQLGME
ncbi:NUDIX domain-containing protein [Cyanobium sp. NIES-981]|uniref:NUDIX domain-containing protein n=1 Tax=Cyanobium sp. NIES-981 TaxID=1851505 RepID=UPI0007DD51AF|nr:NUDIX hydrolase [Cyanobium sp. NIES-981]SBO43740.1 Nudix hydrolase [Cyanobium sp. NIES-981]